IQGGEALPKLPKNTKYLTIFKEILVKTRILDTSCEVAGIGVEPGAHALNCERGCRI
ncbi:hypothetical protein KI387_044331, partial [Taxus chinensis]